MFLVFFSTGIYEYSIRPEHRFTVRLWSLAHDVDVEKEPGAWAHNFDYVLQLVIDSIDDLGGSVGGYIRP